MARNFAKRIYGPYFPYNHRSGHKEIDEKSLETRLESFFKKIISKFKKSS